MSANLGMGIGSIAVEAVFGYAGAALFTTINPLVGALFGVTSSVITSVAKEILSQARWTSPAANVLANGIGILGGAAVVALVAGTTLTPSVALGLFISILAAKIIFGLATLLCGCGVAALSISARD